MPRDVNGAGRVRVVAPPYPYPSDIRYAGTRLFFFISAGIPADIYKIIYKINI